MFLKYVTSIFLIFLAVLESTAAEETSTTTITVTPTVTSTVTVAYLEDLYETVYEYTNSLGKSTTTTVTGSTHIRLFTPLPPSQAAASATGTASIGNINGASLSTQPTSVPSSIPLGKYSTSEYTKTTTIEDGSSAVVEYVVLYTSTC